MAQFRGTVRGTRGVASRLGSKNSGLHVTANGWTGGVSVDVYEKDGRDWAHVIITPGSTQGGRNITIHNGPIDGAWRAAQEERVQ